VELHNIKEYREHMLSNRAIAMLVSEK
jgi:hypothetical protein